MINQSNRAGEQARQKHHGHFHIPDEIRHLGDMSLYRAVAWWGFLRKTEFTRDDVSQALKGMLRTLIKVTCGYPAISDEVGRNSKSIMRMLSPDVDPGVKAFMPVVRAAERQSEKAAARAKIH